MNMLSPSDVSELVHQRTSLELGVFERTTMVVVDQDPDRFAYVLYGPYGDPDDRNFYLWVSCAHETNFLSLQILAQDATDGVFLNSRAEGAEKYAVGHLMISPFELSTES